MTYVYMLAASFGQPTETEDKNANASQNQKRCFAKALANT